MDVFAIVPEILLLLELIVPFLVGLIFFRYINKHMNNMFNSKELLDAHSDEIPV
jgi:hypothetical protein